MKTPARKPISPPQHFEKTPTADSAGPEASLTRLQFCFFLSGAAGLIDQVVWTKALGLLFGYSAYAVASVLAVFMGGLALGGVVFACLPCPASHWFVMCIWQPTLTPAVHSYS
jgi:hypothetical protein